ncbi:MAG: VOC family protein [Bacillota bacterium]|nr:VOC family protein [Bacillota bacterium]
MKLSHILMKVENLDHAVNAYREKGFVVEYGIAKNPYNALIYFSEGPYIELIAGVNMPNAIKKFMRLLGKGYMVDLLDRINNATPGEYCELALENYKDNLDMERAILKEHGVQSCGMPSRRNDTRGRKLRFRLAVPETPCIPFMMTYFNIDPKPKNFVHPNGIRRVSRVTFRTDARYFDLIRALCDDKHLSLEEGRGIEVEFDG